MIHKKKHVTKNFNSPKDPIRQMKRQVTDWEKQKYLGTTYLTKH
jgi:hypothetical protein